MTALDTALLVLELIGTTAFSASGAMTALRKGMDLFGVCVMGLTTAVGGGVIRDVVLGHTPPETFQNPVYATVAVAAALVLFLPQVRRWLDCNRPGYEIAMLVMDTLGLGIFTIMGVRTAWLYVEGPTLFLAAFVGVVTGVGGGVLRDVLAGDMPYIFVKHVYACASLTGAVLYALLRPAAGELISMLAGMGAVFLIRGLSAHYRWNLPKARYIEPSFQEEIKADDLP